MLTGYMKGEMGRRSVAHAVDWREREELQRQFQPGLADTIRLREICNHYGVYDPNKDGFFLHYDDIQWPMT